VITMHGHMHGWDEWRKYGFIGQKGWLLILFALYNKELTGSEIIELAEKESGGLTRLSPSLVYPYLRELKLSGFLDSEEKDNKIYYKLSDKGKALIEQASNYFPGWRLRYEFYRSTGSLDGIISYIEDSVQYIVDSLDKSKITSEQKERIQKIINKLSNLIT